MDCPHCGKPLPVGVRYVFSKHGHASRGGRARSRTYLSWRNMIARCTQPSNPSYRHYKKLGIGVCPEWRDFTKFLADMGERPAGMSLDRIKTLEGYRLGNCRWATKREQANNRVTNVTFEYKGKRLTLAELARTTGVSKSLLRTRLCRSKLPLTIAGAVETPQLSKQDTRSGFYR